MARIAIVHYSVQGHIRKMSQAMLEGINSVEGCTAEIYRVDETLSPAILEKIKPVPRTDPVISAQQLPDFDGLAFGMPTRFGMMPSQMKALWDATGAMWQAGSLVGKPVTAFTSVASQGGGIETTIFSAVTQFTHHGMIFVPPGYTFGEQMFAFDEIRGGTPWGASCYAGADGSREPSELELAQARHQGRYFAKVVQKLASGSAAAAK